MSNNDLVESMQQLVHWSSVHTPADMDIDSIRAAYDALCRNYTPPRSNNLKVQDGLIKEQGIVIPYRMYYPTISIPKAGWPVVFYLHGGGFVVGDLDSHEVITSPMVTMLGVAVMVIDYRLAPEFPYPAAVNDIRAGWRYMLSHANELHIDLSKIVVAGDSAGGTLAAILAQETKTDKVKPIGQVLIYPLLTMVESLASHQEHKYAPLMNHDDLDWYYDLYSPNVNERYLAELSPLSAQDFSGLPPTFVAIAEIDPLADEGKLYCERLTQAGVEADLYVGEGLLHGSLRAWQHSVEAEQMFLQCISAIKRMKSK